MRGQASGISIAQPKPAPARPGEERSGFRGWMLVFVAAFALYAISANPEAHWQDAGQYELRVAEGQLVDPEGLCRSHPLHFFISTAAVELLPVTLPMAMSLISALAGSIAVANVFGIVKQWTGLTSAALLGAAGLALSESFWQFSCIPGAHIITATILTAEFWALLNWDLTRKPRWLILMFLANGVGLANHDMALLSLPVIGVVLLIALFRHYVLLQTAIACAMAWIAGSSIYLWLIVEQMRTDGLATAIHSALVGRWGEAVAGQDLLLTYTATSVAFTLLSFPNLVLPAVVLGIARGRRLGTATTAYWALLASLIMQLGFVLRYNVISQYAFLVPAYALMAVFAGLGFAVVIRTWPSSFGRKVIAVATILMVLTPATYLAACVITRHYHALGRWARNKPYRDDYRYLLIPWSRGEHSAQSMSLHAASLAGNHGLIAELDGMGVWAVQYQLLLQGKSDVRVMRGVDPEAVMERVRVGEPVVLAPFNLDDRLPAPPVGQWDRVGDLYVLNPTEKSAVPSQESAR
jgi:hypothetical protein